MICVNLQGFDIWKISLQNKLKHFNKRTGVSAQANTRIVKFLSNSKEISLKLRYNDSKSQLGLYCA